MAKNLKNEDLVLNIIINGDKGRNEIKKLNESIASTNENLKKLEDQQRKLKGTTEEGGAEWNRLGKEIEHAKNAIEMAEDRIKNLRSGLTLTNKTLRDLQADAVRLRKLLSMAVPGSENYKRYQAELTATNDRIKELTATTQGSKVTIGKLADGVNKYIGLVSAFVGSFAFTVMGARKAAEAFAEYDDSLADVMKTTGLTKVQVESLSGALAKIDTRSSQLELLDLAKQAGKLGISAKEDVEEFVKAADKIGVALGEDLGDKEQAINTIGKLVDLFKVKEEFGIGEGMLKVGSVINQLGMSSTANEAYIVEFTKRVGGMAVQAGVSIESVMGLGATLDSLGQTAEVSSTVFNKVISGMFKRTSEYAKIAGMDVQEFSTLIKTDINEALLKVFEGMGDAGLETITKMLGEVKEEGARSAQVIATLAANTAEVRRQQLLANEAFKEGTSINEEFAIKNETAQARLEKAQKAAQERLIELGRTLQPVMSGAVSGFSALIRILTVVVDLFIRYKGVLMFVASAYAIYIAQQKIALFFSQASNATRLQSVLAFKAEQEALKAGTVTTGTYTLAQKALITVKALLAGQLKIAGAALKSFFVSMGPIGWAITAATVLISVMSALDSSKKESANASTDLAMKLQQERDTLEDLKKAAIENQEGSVVRAEAIKMINEKYGEYLPNLLTEKSTNEEIATAMKDVNSAMEDNIKIKFRKQAMEESQNKLYAEQKKLIDELVQKYIESGNKSDEQVALATVKFAELTNKLIKTGDKMEFATGVAEMFGMELNKIANPNNGFMAMNVEGKTQAITQHFDKLLSKAQKTNNEIAILNAMIGGPKTPENKDQDTPCPKCGKKHTGDCDKPCPKCGKKHTGDCEKPTKQKWSLGNDQKYNEQAIALKRQLLNGEIATQEEYDKKVLALEVETLNQRIALKKEKGADMLALEKELLDKQLNQQKNERQRIDKLQRATDGGLNDMDKENLEYEKRLKDLELFGKNREDMTQEELSALLVLEKQHNAALSSIYTKDLSDRATKSKKEVDKILSEKRLANAAELSLADTLEKKKLLLRKWFSDAEIKDVKTTKEADKRIRDQYQKEESEALKMHLSKMLADYQAISQELSTSGISGGAVELTEADAEKLQDIIDKLREELSKLAMDTATKLDVGGNENKVDVLGMSAEDWQTLFKNTEDGKTSLEKIAIAAKFIGDAMGDTFRLMNALDQRELKGFETSQNKKKQALDKRLKANRMSQEQYNKEIEKIDQQTEEKRIEMDRKAAEREKATAIFSAIMSASLATLSALYSGGPIAAGIAAAIGAVQVATIIATPLPGREQGSWLDVEREQDGKLFHAKVDPQKRGVVNQPTVIVGENGTEYVVPKQGYENPTIRPFLSVIEQARIQGRLKDINLYSAMGLSTSGREGGGYSGSASSHSTNSTPSPSNFSSDRTSVIVDKFEKAVDKFANSTQKPLEAYLVLDGEKGAVKKIDNYKKRREQAVL